MNSDSFTDIQSNANPQQNSYQPQQNSYQPQTQPQQNSYQPQPSPKVEPPKPEPTKTEPVKPEPVKFQLVKTDNVEKIGRDMFDLKTKGVDPYIFINTEGKPAMNNDKIKSDLSWYRGMYVGFFVFFVIFSITAYYISDDWSSRFKLLAFLNLVSGAVLFVNWYCAVSALQDRVQTKVNYLNNYLKIVE